MDLSEIAAVTGLPGLFKIAARRNDGVIVNSLIDNKPQFIASRAHMFTTLEHVTIYTTGEPATLKDVLAAIKKKEGENPLPDGKDDAKVKAWMEAILPDYDKEKVYVSDMKKLLKWYSILNSANLIAELTAEKSAEETAGKEEDGEKKEVKKETKKETKPKGGKKDLSGKGVTKPAPAAKKITTPRKAS